MCSGVGNARDGVSGDPGAMDSGGLDLTTLCAGQEEPQHLPSRPQGLGAPSFTIGKSVWLLWALVFNNSVPVGSPGAPPARSWCWCGPSLPSSS